MQSTQRKTDAPCADQDYGSDPLRVIYVGLIWLLKVEQLVLSIA
jgi:hypothetical protein